MRGFLALARKSWRSLGHGWRLARRQPALKVAVIAVFSFVLVGGLFALFYAGFRFLSDFGGAGLMIIQRLFALFFFGLGIMLVFSSAVTSYATVFRSAEIPFLLLRPLDVRETVLFKSLESAVLASWAFFFMILPFVCAYTAYEGLSWLFAVAALVFSIPFVLLCSAAGTVLCLLTVRWMPRPRVALILLAAVAALGVASLARKAVGTGFGEDAALVLTRLIPGMKVSAWPLWPSWWVAEGILSVAHGRAARAALFLAVLVANTGLAAIVIEQMGTRWFVRGWRRIGAGAARPRRAASWRALAFALGFLPRDVRALVIKDVRAFLRDPVQWSQAAIFFGLLGLYFANLRGMRYHALPELWRQVIVFINMLSVSSVVASLSSRFVYPQMSLEGQSFWVVGLSPMPPRRLLRAKFWTAAVPLLAVSGGLVGISAGMLKLSPDLLAVSMALSMAVALAIAGFSTGLGAVFMDLRQRNPAAIVSSFGGTLNLVFCLGFTLGAVLPFAALYHFEGLGRLAPGSFVRLRLLMLAALAVATALAVGIPLALGRRRLERREYADL